MPLPVCKPSLFSTIEPLEGRIAPAVVSVINADILTISSDAASDSVTIKTASGDATMLIVAVGNDGTTEFPVPKASFNAITFDGLAGGDTLIVSYVNGDPLGSKPLTANMGGDAGDSLAIAGTGAENALATPSGVAAHSGSVTIAAATIAYSGAAGGVELGTFASVSITTPSGADSYTLGSANTGVGSIAGTSSGMTHKFTYTSIASLTLDLSVSDGAATTADQLTVNALAGTGLQNLTVNTAGGDDTLALAVASLNFPTTGGAFTYNAGAGNDTVAATADTSMVLSDIALAFTGGGSLALSGIEVANLIGGASANSFTLGGWSGTGTLDGAGGIDTVAATNDPADFVLSDTSLSRTGLGSLTLASIEVANLAGEAGANTFTVTGWTGNGTLAGGGGADKLVAVKTQTASASTHGFTFTLSDSSLATSDGMSFTLSAIGNADLSAPQNLPGNYRFHVAAWSHEGTFTSASGTNLFVAGTGKQSFNGGSGKDTYFLQTGINVDYSLTDRSNTNQNEKGDRVSFELAGTGVTFDLFNLKGKSVTQTVIQQLNEAGTAGKVTIAYLDVNTNPDKPGRFLSPFQNIEGSRFADKLRGAGDGSTENIYGGVSDPGVKVTDRLTGGKGINFLLGGNGSKQKTIFAKGGPGTKYAFTKVNPADAFTDPSRYPDVITNFSNWA